ncbi:MAG: hypothetical protein QOH26_360 [Actinomycetota bacterium]|nr:hypothetical protein [Actinomycetota bacterium]
MRLSDLLGEEVFDVDGRRVGKVHDVRVVQDGPLIGTFGAAFRIDGLIVGKGSLGARMGFDRSEMKGPYLLKVFFNARHAGTKYVPWDSVAAIEEGKISLNRVGGELKEPDVLSSNRMSFA